MEPGVGGARENLIVRAANGIELRPMTPDHANALYLLIDRNRARLREWLPWVEWSYDRDDVIAFLREQERDNAARIGLSTMIFANGQMCGAISLHAIDDRHRNTSIGYWLDAGFEGRGIMTEACRAMVTAGFRRYKLHRIEIRCATGNPKSCAIPRRLGFVEEGVLREAQWLFDHWVDLRVFSMLDEQWK